MSLEAAAGKNPVSHVGKVYTVLAHEIASALHAGAVTNAWAAAIRQRRGAPRTSPPASRATSSSAPASSNRWVARGTRSRRFLHGGTIPDDVGISAL